MLILYYLGMVSVPLVFTNNPVPTTSVLAGRVIAVESRLTVCPAMVTPVTLRFLSSSGLAT